MGLKQALSTLTPGRGMATHVAWMARDFGRRDYSPFSPADLEALAGTLDALVVPAGQRILSAGQAADTAYVVESGEIELLVRRGGRRSLVAVERAGSVLGDVPLLCDMAVPFDAIARTEATLLKLERAVLLDLLARHPAIALRWLTSLVRRLERANRRVVELTVGDLRGRTLALIADELVTGDRRGVRLTQAEMAALLGATRQSVNRVLRHLAREGLVTQRYGEVHIADPARILELAGGGSLLGVC